MNGILENRYQMYLSTQGYVRLYPTITSKLPGFDGHFMAFVANNDSIRVIKEQLEHGNSGLSENKELLRTNLVKHTLEVCKKVEVYAMVNGNTILAKEVHYTLSELKKARGTSLIDKALIVYSKAMEQADELEKYGVTATMLTALNTSIDGYRALIPTIRIRRMNQKLNNECLKEQFKANDEALKMMDLLVELVKDTNPDFYKGYRNIRKVIEHGGGSLSLRAKVTCAHDGTKIKGAKATFTLKTNLEAMAEEEVSVKPIVKKTADKGIFQIKNIPEGVYMVTIEKVGYSTKTVKVNITDSEMAKLNVKLDRN